MLATTTLEEFTTTETMTVTFALDWGVITITVDADTDDLSYLVTTAETVALDNLATRHDSLSANEVYVTNSHGETVEVSE